jgi:hypothetical protein
MSLWTPSGEHPVDRRPESQPETPTPTGPEGDDGPSLEDLSPEQRAQVEAMAQQMEEARARMLQAPGGVVVGQQALQFYELAAVYLSEEPPRLEDAKRAIDALAAVVEKLGDRLGQVESPLRQALNQIQLAYVEVSKGAGPDQ